MNHMTGGGLGGEGVCLPRTPFGLKTAPCALYLPSFTLLSGRFTTALHALYYCSARASILPCLCSA